MERRLIRTIPVFALLAIHAAQAAYASPIDTGFHLLYETRFVEARSEFRAWEKAHPQDPLGYAWEAASYLFEELYEQGVLTSAFFVDDKRLLGGVAGNTNREHLAGFLAASKRARELADQRLAANPEDPDALFALTVTTGMLADSASLLERRQLESLRLVRQAEGYAERLLQVKPGCADAYLALGVANYIIGSLPAYKRFFLRLGGIRGNRELGMHQLATVAQRGECLRPFAKVLLALAAVREKNVVLARQLFEQLVAEFPQNPAFAHELALLSKPGPPVAALSTPAK